MIVPGGFPSPASIKPSRTSAVNAPGPSGSKYVKANKYNFVCYNEKEYNFGKIWFFFRFCPKKGGFSTIPAA